MKAIMRTLLICLTITIGHSFAENILFYFPLASYSHRIPVWPLVTHLADQGHQVTFLSAYPPKDPHPNVTEIVPKEFGMLLGEHGETSVVGLRRDGLVPESWGFLDVLGLQFCEVFISNPEYQQWINKSKFDLVVIDGLFNECGLGLVHKFKSKHITYATTAPCMWQIDAFGMIPEANWIPDMQYYFPVQMNIIERLKTAYNMLSWHRLRQNDEEFARSLPPHVIPVGGMHIQNKTKPLPKVINDFINKGDKDFVFISFGSHVNLAKEPPEVYAAIMGAMKKLDINFIFKWDGVVPADIPPNVLMQKWISQQDILAHPKIKAFVTHSGLMSITEAIFHGVPLVSLPVTAEQDYNAERIHARGYGVRLEIGSLTENDLADAIYKVVNDPSYKSSMLLKSKQYKDRPMKPLDTAIWWTEFVLRHDDTSFLKPMSIYQSWWRRRSLDIYGIAFVGLALIVVIALKFLQIIVKIVKGNNSSNGTQVKAKKQD
ncbi:unnamed protein product [Allacma fusca]|uniref:UDP-glucuronosyltransferase n=1 Tax=Allacma fusca TaxID=39272 RepID=A0A8J2P513_9HEXA|nr:unnamed protein product [Allacma fusca]